MINVAGIHKDGGTIIGTTNKGAFCQCLYKNKDRFGSGRQIR